MNIPVEVIERLKQFKAENGRLWKSKLRELWFTGADADDALLRQARNLIGPSDLDSVKL